MVEIEKRENLPAHIAVLDRSGVILEVNDAWRRFGLENGMFAPGSCIGMNYIDLCRNSLGADHRLTLELCALLSGRTAMVSWVYPCHSPHEKRWFNLIGVPRRAVRGAIIAHVELTPLVHEAGWEDGPVVETSLPALAPVSIGQRERTATGKRLSSLSPNQSRMLKLVATGMTNAEIAAETGLSVGMVKKQVSGLLRHFDFKSRRELKNNFLLPDDLMLRHL